MLANMLHKRFLLVAAVALSAGATSQNTAPPSPSFDVASVRSYKPDNPNSIDSHWSENPGRLIATHITLIDVIKRAYDVKVYQISGPAWLGSERYNISAEWPASTPKEQRPLFYQTFLADRFKLAFHREKKMLPVYELRVGKNGPKMRAVDSDGNSSMNTRRGEFVAEKTSMRGFAETLSNELSRPVLDKTGLSGAFNFTLQFASDDSAPDDAASASIFTAVKEQLGLQLVATKGAIDCLIIDHAEKVPTEN